MQEIYGYVERITFQNDLNGFTIAKIQQPRYSELTCIVGVMPGLQPGEAVRCFGEWKVHPAHGRQFEVKGHRVEAPADVLGIKKYLGSGLIKGIGPVYAEKIVETFGTDTLEVIDKTPERLLEIPGLGPKKMEKIQTCWVEQKAIREVMIFLQKYGVSPAYAQKIFKRYGAESVEKVKENPFHLARDIFGIGFKIADTIAEKLGIEKNSPLRIEAGIVHALSELSNEGHTCYPLEDFLVEASKILEVDSQLVERQLDPLVQENRIEIADLVSGGQSVPFIWNKPLYVSENGIAYEIKRLQHSPCCLRKVDEAKALDWVQKKLDIELATNQKAAVAQALIKKMQIITGGPGTGKSTITNAILAITSKLTDKICLAAPTGRAAKRMSEITGKKASTIHSLLEFDFRKGGFKKNRESPLECDLIIVDEASMIDTLLMYSLLKAIPDHARVVLVGDINQLPSVGPGNVLKDMIAAQSLDVTMLNEIFRQAANSRIVTNAHRINNGVFPDITNQSSSDFFFMEEDDPETILKKLVALVATRLPKKYGFHPLNAIQVLAPMKKGVIGTENLNVVLQQTLNPQQNALLRAGRRFTIGDKVMQIRNNYQKEVFNGDIGTIHHIDFEEQEVVVTIDNRDITYETSELDELVLAYAVSIHKYQGSECPCIVIPIHTSHFKLLNRNLLYTGVTRGKRLVVLIGSKKALAIATFNDEVKKRYTGLRQAMMETCNLRSNSP